MYVLENSAIRAEIGPKGAELTSLLNKENGIHYLWRGDPKFWGKHSPILFPIVGALKNNQYYFKGKPYTLPRHGFARELPFSLVEQQEDSVLLQLNEDRQTLAAYPFPFQLQLRYQLQQNTLRAGYRVFNPASEPLWFSIGAHPAFALPLESGLEYSDYYLEFDKPETAGRWPIGSGGLIGSQSIPFFRNEVRLPLKKELFQADALVFKSLQSTVIRLASAKGKAALDFAFAGFPYFGIWAAPGADFICLEPWCGIADSETSIQQLEEKEGIIRLEANTEFSCQWSVTLY